MISHATTMPVHFTAPLLTCSQNILQWLGQANTTNTFPPMALWILLITSHPQTCSNLSTHLYLRLLGFLRLLCPPALRDTPSHMTPDSFHQSFESFLDALTPPLQGDHDGRVLRSHISDLARHVMSRSTRRVGVVGMPGRFGAPGSVPG